MSQKVLDYIASHWDECINEKCVDDGSLIGLPYPYTVPAVGHFDEMYYWDTYFTNIGLIKCGRALQAKHNVENMMYLISRFGRMPNGNRDYFLSRSQPPFLSFMVRDVYEHFNDKAWLAGAYLSLEAEHKFWMEKRITPTGLNRYDDDNTRHSHDDVAQSLEKRIGVKLEGDRRALGRHYLAVCESGHDITPRFELDAYDYNPVDLNALLYGLEANMAYFARELDNSDAAKLWDERAEARKSKMYKLMDKGDGLLTDYNFKTGKISNFFTPATVYALFSHAASEAHAKAFVDNLHRLEADFGILAGEDVDVPGNYQWGYPNGWACEQYLTVVGLNNYGYKQDAVRIAKKYLTCVERVFEETGNLWEKYNVVLGSADVVDEYKMPAMMGWSAGVYLFAKEFVK